MSNFMKFLQEQARAKFQQHQLDPEALEPLLDSGIIRDNAKIHMSPDKTIKPQSTGQWIPEGHGRMNGKPFGLWYALGDQWIRHLLFEYPGGMEPYLFEIDVNMSQIIILDSRDKIKAFEHTYCVGSDQATSWGNYYKPANTDVVNADNKVVRKSCQVPNWQAAARDFSGIEMPEPWLIDSAWGERLDISSGCVWRKSAITNVRMIATYDFNTNRYVAV